MPFPRLLILALALGGLLAACSKSTPPPGGTPTTYQCPMHPWITSDHPGNCTICGMALVPARDANPGADSGTTLKLHDASVAALGVTTVPARRLPLTRALRFSGIFEDDENIHRIVAAFYDGRIEQVFVDHVGQYIEKGRPLASIYSPELLYVVREYQNAARSGETGIMRNAAQRLVQFGLDPGQVAALAKKDGDVYAIDLLAPISGTILVKKAYKGQYIKTGEPLFEMGDLSRLWFHAEVYERDLPDIRAGQKAVVTTPTVPGREFPGEVTFIDPNFNPASRSTQVRIVVDNPVAGSGEHGQRHLLPHRAYAEARIDAAIGESLVLPRSAVLRDGGREIVYVEKSPGSYEPRAVKTGRVGDEGIEILDGLAENERVVAQGNLLIDAEAQLRNVAAAAAPAAPSGSKPAPPALAAFLDQLAGVSAALAADDLVAAPSALRRLPALAKALPMTGGKALDEAIHPLHSIEPPPPAADLAAARRAFLPWSQAGAALALALRQQGAAPGVRVFECPMTGDSFPGAPPRARWVQSAPETRNPYLGSPMLTCGGEVQP
jgi:Cu(I)/Ag(I) efflux system membrane fusion protein